MVIEEDREREDGKFSITNTSILLAEIFNYTNHYIHYFSAHRIGTQDLYTKNFDKYDRFGIFGEYAIDHFQHSKTNEIIDQDLTENKQSFTLEGQVNYWLKRIVNHELNTSNIPGTDKIKADFTSQANKVVRPKNTGSGVSYLIGIIISCLSSNKGDLIIIENPEIHLHPKAQSQLSEFFVFIANAGIQLIIETHSDHIFNGVRVQVFKEVIQKEKVRVHFFDVEESSSTSKHTQVGITDRGRIQNQEAHLFDQFDHDINSLIGL
jgi:predicted ATPase